MTLIEVQVPVTRFAVSYEIGQSRPYSVFERLLLKAVADGSTDLATLTAQFCVPARIVVEGVVTLVQAGWVGLSPGDNALALTASGADALGSGSAPTTLATRRPHPMHVVLERATGALARNDFRLVPQAKLREPDGKTVVRLAAAVHDNRIDTGDVRPLIRTSPGEWVRWIDSESQLVTKGSQAAVGYFDTESGRLSEVAPAFRLALEPILAARFGGVGRGYVPEESADAADFPTHAVTIASSDVVVNAGEHARMLTEALESATSAVAICSAFVRKTVIEDLAIHISRALARGVAVDVLWGYDSPEVPGAVDALKKVKYDNRGTAGTLTFNQEPSRSHAKVLVWDTDIGVSACIGSYNWLSAAGTPLGEMSVRLREPRLVSDVARFVSDRWFGIRDSDTVRRRWQQLAGRWETIPFTDDSDGPTGDASLVFGRAHEALFRRAVVDPGPGVLVVVSHQVTNTGIRRLTDGVGIKREHYAGAAVVGEFIGVGPNDLMEACNAIGAKAMHKPVHAKLLLHRDAAIVGSYNFLSADPASHGDRARELSVHLIGEDIRRLIQSRLPQLWGRVS